LLNDLNQKKSIENKLKWSFGLHMIADQQAKLLATHDLVTT